VLLVGAGAGVGDDGCAFACILSLHTSFHSPPPQPPNQFFFVAWPHHCNCVKITYFGSLLIAAIHGCAIAWILDFGFSSLI
jgi:hypothetical protein